MDMPDLQSSLAQGAHFFWLLEVVPGSDGNAFANQIILQSDKPNGIWFASDGAAATWRPGWWRITQQPATISICFAWRDGIQAKVRTYVRHRVFHFYWNASASAGDIKMLLPLSPDGRWNPLLPIPLQHIVLDQFHAFTALREETGIQEQYEPKSEAGEATELEEQ